MSHISEYEVENILIDRLESIGYSFIKLNTYEDVLANFRAQLAEFNAKKLEEKGHAASFSDTEFNRIMIHMDNHSVYESAKILRDKYILQLDNGENVYLDFFSNDTDRNIYQVTHQVTMDKAHKEDVVYKNRYDVTVLINGLPMIQIELKRPGVEINEAINQINRYRKFSFKGLFRYLQLFVVSNSVQTKYFCNENEMVDGRYNPILKSLVFFWTDDKNTRINDLNTFTSEFFCKPAITEMIDKYMIIKTTEPVLMVMRPYQIYAVKAAKKRVLEVNQNGYVFACTGSGKTLTSFKLAQILRDEARVDLVVFLIDRKDLDDQTVEEYNSFEKDCVDNTDSTRVLIQMLKLSEKKMIVTTIQKMANAVKNPKYEAFMDDYRDKKVVFIIDECHRSQFGSMHAQIQKHFEKANYIGFTGTPIFEKNKGADGRTTADVFHAGEKLDACLHRYMIKDAIADGNVLRFSVEYQRTISAKNVAEKGIDPEQLDDPEYCKRHNIDMIPLYHDEERITRVAKHIMEHHEQHVHPQGKDTYTALFAVDSIPTLGKYYDAFQKLNKTVPEEKRLKIAAIFSYQANEDIVFVYAVRDDIFTREDRTKFFDFIIPVVPVVNATNSGEILLEKLDDARRHGIYHDISQGFVLDVAPFISDMRVLQNIYNEFVVYKKTLQTEQHLKLSDEQMMAIIVFKNLYPRDFADIQGEEGIIKKAFQDKNSYIIEKREKWQEKIEYNKELIEKVSEDTLKSIKELKYAMLIAITEGKGVTRNFTDSSYLRRDRGTFAVNVLSDDFDLPSICHSILPRNIFPH